MLAMCESGIFATRDTCCKWIKLPVAGATLSYRIVLMNKGVSLDGHLTGREGHPEAAGKGFRPSRIDPCPAPFACRN